MKGILTMVLMVWSLTAFSQSMNQVLLDPRIEKEVLMGLCDRSGLKLPVFEAYYTPEYATYAPDAEIISKLKQVGTDWQVHIVLGTWCSDSQREVPRFYRIMDVCGFPEQLITMYGVGRDKQAGESDISDLKVTLVPTFVFFREGKEIGRIIESPLTSLEEDMLGILTRKE